MSDSTKLTALTISTVSHLCFIYGFMSVCLSWKYSMIILRLYKSNHTGGWKDASAWGFVDFKVTQIFDSHLNQNPFNVIDSLIIRTFQVLCRIFSCRCYGIAPSSYLALCDCPRYAFLTVRFRRFYWLPLCDYTSVLLKHNWLLIKKSTQNHICRSNQFIDSPLERSLIKLNFLYDLFEIPSTWLGLMIFTS